MNYLRKKKYELSLLDNEICLEKITFNPDFQK